LRAGNYPHIWRGMANTLLDDIEAFCAAHGMRESTFGRKAVKDWRFIQELRGTQQRKPRRVWPETERAVRHFMVTYRPDAEDAQRDAAA
jgi:hypothetical protein